DELTQDYNDSGKTVQLFMISDSGFKVLMDRYDPFVKVIHDDIEIANEVGSDEVFDYLIDQADKLGASDIHIENQRTHMRIRMRIDGVLHPVADLENERYRVILSALASRANI